MGNDCLKKETDRNFVLPPTNPRKKIKKEETFLIV